MLSYAVAGKTTADIEFNRHNEVMFVFACTLASCVYKKHKPEMVMSMCAKQRTSAFDETSLEIQNKSENFKIFFVKVIHW